MKPPLPHRHYHSDSKNENQKDYWAQLQKRKLRILNKKGLTKRFCFGFEVHRAEEYWAAVHILCSVNFAQAQHLEPLSRIEHREPQFDTYGILEKCLRICAGGGIQENPGIILR